MLSAKVEAVEFVAAQIGPEFLFSGSEFKAQFNGRPPPNLPRLRPAKDAGRNQGRDKTRPQDEEFLFSSILHAASFPKFDAPQSHLGKVPAGRMGRVKCFLPTCR